MGKNGATGISPEVMDQERSVDAHIGSVIFNRRTELGYSQAKVAELLGVSFQQIQKYERGKNTVAPGRLMRLAAILQLQVVDFYPDQNAPKTEMAPAIARISRELHSLNAPAQAQAIDIICVMLTGLKKQAA